jgi:tetratricopeptide (TPR) repeat protein
MSLEKKIDRYLSGQMSIIESDQFKKDMANDTALQKEVQLQQLALISLQMQGEARVKSMLQKHEAQKTSIFSLPRLGVLIAVVIGCLIWFYYSQKPEVPAEDFIMAQYFKPYKNPTMLRGQEQLNDWTRGTQAYANSNYELAARAFSSIESDTVAPLYLVKFYWAISLMASETKDSSKSIQILSEVAQGQHDYVQQARWYLALAYLEAGDREEGIKLLKEINELRQFNHVEAEQLLQVIQQDSSLLR